MPHYYWTVVGPDNTIDHLKIWYTREAAQWWVNRLATRHSKTNHRAVPIPYIG